MLKKSTQILAAGLLLLSAMALEAVQPETGLDVITGWKRGEIKTSLNAQDPEGETFGYFPLKVKNINVWQAGLQGRYAIPNYFENCNCETAWLTQFYLRGFAYWGKVYDGKYSERSEIIGGNNNRNHAKVKRGHTRDLDIALGWLYPWCDNLGFGPVVGYNYQKIKTKNGKMTDQNGDEVSGANHLRIVSRFKGPYVGADFVYDLCDFRFNFGYEYHMPTWSGKYQLAVYDNEDAFSDKRTARRGHGNVGYLDTRYHFCGCWELGLGLRYEAYRTGKGTASPECCEACNDVPSSEVDRIRTKWRAFTINLELALTY